MSATRPILTAVRDYLAAELPAYTASSATSHWR